jgi:hypothetical protein
MDRGMFLIFNAFVSVHEEASTEAMDEAGNKGQQVATSLEGSQRNVLKCVDSAQNTFLYFYALGAFLMKINNF